MRGEGQPTYASGGSYTAASCASLFPATPTRQRAKEVVQLRTQLVEAEALPAGPDRVRTLAQLRQHFARLERVSGKGLRLDVHVVDPTAARDSQVLVDVTCVHPTCLKRLPAEFRRTEARIASALEARERNCRDPRAKETDGAAALIQTRHKHAKYAPLMSAIQSQVAKRCMPCVPRFLAACMTTHGEMGRETVALIEWVTRAYGRRLARDADDDDGISRASKTARFRSAFRVAMINAALKGNARMTLSCGLPL